MNLFIFYFYRWNSTFDAVLQLVTLIKKSKEKINLCMDYCNLPRLTDHEINFLEEYCKVKYNKIKLFELV